MSPVDAVPGSLYQQFAGWRKLTDFFGYWPAFEDAEVLRLRLAAGTEPSASARLTLLVHAFAWDQEPSGRTIITHHCVAALRFDEVEESHLMDFSARNVLVELRLSPHAGDPDRRCLVELAGARGLTGRFTCGQVHVLGVFPGIPAGSIYRL